MRTVCLCGTDYRVSCSYWRRVWSVWKKVLCSNPDGFVCFFCFRSDSYIRHVRLDMNEGLLMIVKVVCCWEYFTSFLAHYPIPFQLFFSHYDGFQFECSLHFIHSLNDTWPCYIFLGADDTLTTIKIDKSIVCMFIECNFKMVAVDDATLICIFYKYTGYN